MRTTPFLFRLRRWLRWHEGEIAITVILILPLVLLFIVHRAHGMDNGQWAQATPQMREWFGKLQSRNHLLCCQDADGFDAQWDTVDGMYRVFDGTRWVVVPNVAIVDGPNLIGVAKVWWQRDRTGAISGIRCFMPGAQG
jgi:hypothetical protein